MSDIVVGIIGLYQKELIM